MKPKWRLLYLVLWTIFCCGFMPLSYAQNEQEEEEKAKVNFTFGGYAKMDVLISQYTDGHPDPESPLRDFHIPSVIPVGGEPSAWGTDFHVKESRFFFDVRSTLWKREIRAFAELDFLLSPAGNERISNSYNPRMRHFFFEYDRVLVGQTWTTFMMVILPDELDFIGAPEGVVFARQPMIRLRLGNWQFALENPETTITPYQKANCVHTKTGLIPDLIVRRDFQWEKGEVGVAAMFRQLHHEAVEGEDSVLQSHINWGYGLTAGGKLQTWGLDDIRFSLTAGSGLGRYVGLNFVSSAGIDEGGSLHPIKTLNAYLAYKHHWADQWRSSVSISSFIADLPDEIIDEHMNKMAWSASVNLIYSPRPDLLLGVEYIHGQRHLANEAAGRMNRIQFSARYNFAFSSPLIKNN